MNTQRSRWRHCVAVVATCISAAVTGPPSPAAGAETPVARSAASSAPDPSTGTVLLFGGSNSVSGRLNDTWAWTGAEWQRRQPNGTTPSARSAAAMAYDAVTKTVVLFGGQGSSGALNDTYVWNGRSNTWSNVTPAAPGLSPPPRAYGTMAWDAVNKTVLLFGGTVNSGNHTGQLNDTWAWNGVDKTWTRLDVAVSPPPRAFHAMAEDKATKKVVLFGGLGTLSILLGDTWTWDGVRKAWTEQTPANSPPARRFAAMAYDGARSTAVLFGGDNVNSFLTDTWTWNGTTGKWKLRTPTNSPAAPRSSPSMAYHSGTQKVVLFSGNSQSETWTWNGTNWKRPV